jgi:cobalt-zinc-cadmium efflux system membrane fusion protein
MTMNIDTNSLKIGKGQLIAIAVIAALGVVLGGAILADKSPKATEDEGHGHDSHVEAKADGEGRPHEAPGQQAHGGKPASGQEGAPGHEEGKVELSDAQIQAASIAVDTAGAARIKSALQLPGEIRLNEDRTSHVVPRMAGVVESVQASLGQAVRKGQVLAVIASPAASEQRSELQTAQKRLALARITFEREKRLWEQKISAEQDYLQAGQALHEAEAAVANAQQKLSALGLAPGSPGGLSRFELRAPFDGLVIEKHLSLGEAVKEDAAVFTVSDLGRVWAEINVPAKDLPRVRVGERVIIQATAFDASANGTITFVGSLIGEQTRMAKARVVLANPQGAWRPGLFVTVEVTASEADVPVTVSSEAIQTVGDRPVVFLKVDGGFIAQPVQLGRSDGKRVEVVQGLKPGAPHAAAGSFVVKSELGKASAEHTH